MELDLDYPQHLFILWLFHDKKREMAIKKEKVARRRKHMFPDWYLLSPFMGCILLPLCNQPAPTGQCMGWWCSSPAAPVIASSAPSGACSSRRSPCIPLSTGIAILPSHCAGPTRVGGFLPAYGPGKIWIYVFAKLGPSFLKAKDLTLWLFLHSSSFTQTHSPLAMQMSKVTWANIGKMKPLCASPTPIKGPSSEKQPNSGQHLSRYPCACLEMLSWTRKDLSICLSDFLYRGQNQW